MDSCLNLKLLLVKKCNNQQSDAQLSTAGVTIFVFFHLGKLAFNLRASTKAPSQLSKRPETVDTSVTEPLLLLTGVGVCSGRAVYGLRTRLYLYTPQGLRIAL